MKELEPGDVVVDAEIGDELTVTIYLGSLAYRLCGGEECIPQDIQCLTLRILFTSPLDLYAAITELSGPTIFDQIWSLRGSSLKLIMGMNSF